MQSKLTWWLSGAALALFAFIYFFERDLPNKAERQQAPRILSRFGAADIDAVKITFPDGKTIKAQKNNRQWVLTDPAYPAQQAALENFVTNIVALRMLDQIPAHEVALQGAKSFGFEPPRATIQITAGTNRAELQIGNVAPLTNNIYLRAGSGDVLLADGHLVQNLPRSENDWRSTSVVSLPEEGFDRLEVRVGPRSFQVERNRTNDLWQITRPIPARADQERVNTLIQQLRAAQVTQFVADGPGINLEQYALQSPGLELSFSLGSNRLYTIEFGAPSTNQPGEIYARLRGQSNVVLVSSSLADSIRQPYKAFHASHLIDFDPASLVRLSVNSFQDFTLNRQPGGTWQVEGREKLPIDPQLLSRFFTNLLEVQILDIAREVPAEADLRAIGLTTPLASYAITEKLTNNLGVQTNIIEIRFGTNLPNRADLLYTRRSDETPVYVSPFNDWFKLPRAVVQLRERQLWTFDPANAVSLTLSNNSGSALLTRKSSGWSDDPVLNAALEETVVRLSSLEAVEILAEGEQRPGTLGIGPDSLVLQIAVKEGDASRTYQLRFGKPTLNANVYAQAHLPVSGELLMFEFPGTTYQLILNHLPPPR